jgi:hypothetical protein
MKSFTAILDEALTPPAGDGREHRFAASMFLPSGDAPPPAPGSAAERTQALYRELMEDAEPVRERPTPTPLRRRDPLADLEALRPRVAAARSHAELAALRRNFARRHHPDLAPDHMADASERAMREANAMIDSAARQLG